MVCRMPVELLPGLLTNELQYRMRTFCEQPYLQEILKGSLIDGLDGVLMDIAQSHLWYMTDTDTTTGIDLTVGVDDDILEE